MTVDASMTEHIRLGISSCLLGNEVRYNGGHQRDRFITFVDSFSDVLAEAIKAAFVPVP